MADRTQWIERWRAELLAGLGSGFLLALCFPPFPTRFLAVAALVPFFGYYIMKRPGGEQCRASDAESAERCYSTAAADREVGRSPLRAWLKRGFVLGFFLGIAFFTTLLFWIVKIIPASGVTMPWVLGPGLVLLVAYLSCYTGLAALSISAATFRFGRGALFAAPALWSLAEFARSHGELGFSWGILADSLAIHPVAIQGVSFYGPFGLSLVLVFLNLFLAYVIFGSSTRARVCAALAFVVVAGGHLLWGELEIAHFDRTKVSLSPTNNVAVAQPDIDLDLKWDPTYRDSIFVQMGELCREASARGSQLIIFPETAAPVSFKATPRYLGLLEFMARDNKLDILTGYVDHTRIDDEWQAQNAAALIRADGEFTGNYHKVNLLPFGEKMPFSEYFPVLSKPNFVQANFIAGKEQPIFHSSVGNFGVLICFESTFSDFTRRYVRSGADFLVNITNDGWFGSTRGPIQHAEMAILRSVENRVTLFRAAYTGVSMVVDPVGRVQTRLGLAREGIIYGAAARAAKPSVFTRFGYTVYFAMAIANLALVYLALLLRR